MTTNQTAPRPRGRPRPDDTISRDERVLELLGRGSLSRQELADRLGVNINLAYLSLRRLRQQGRVHQIHATEGDARTYLWELTS